MGGEVGGPRRSWGRKTIIRIYCMEKKAIFNKRTHTKKKERKEKRKASKPCKKQKLLWRLALPFPALLPGHSQLTLSHFLPQH